MTSLDTPISYKSHAQFDLPRPEHPQRHTRFPLVLCLLALAGANYAMYVWFFGNAFSERAQASFCWMYLIVTIVFLISKLSRPKPHNWLSPDVVFWIMFTLFHVPYPVLYLLGMADYSHRIFFSPAAANSALCVVVLCLIGFLVGYELGAFGRPAVGFHQRVPRISHSLFQGSEGLFLAVFVAAALILSVTIGPLLLSYGYHGFRRLERYGVGAEAQRFVSLSLTLLRLGATIYIAGCIMRHGKALKGWFLPTLFVGWVAFFTLLGARSEVAVAVLPVLLAHHYFVKPIKLRFGIPLFLGVLVFVGLLRIGRNAKSLSPVDVYEAYNNYRQDTGVDPFVATLHETGGTLSTVNVTCSFVPSHEPFWYGRSLVQSAINIIPSPMAGLRVFVAPSGWVTYRATGRVGGEQAGFGSSIAMEAYLNFGIVGGAALLAAIGVVMRRIYDKALAAPTFLRVCLLLVAVTGLAMWTRNYSHHFLRPVAWTVFVAWVVHALFAGAGGARGPSRMRTEGKGAASSFLP